MRKIAILGIILIPLLLSSCSSLQTGGNNSTVIKRELDTIEVRKKQAYLEHPYHPAQARRMDLVHTELRLKPIWEKTSLKGKASLTVTPYFYPQDSVIVDAHNFDLHSVELKKDTNENKPLAYRYDTQELVIQLPKTYEKADTAEIIIDYKAKLTDLKADDQSVAGSKGMFFINPEEKIPGKPRQIWTQGETEFSSHWFPTFDQPNEKTTQELTITVDTSYMALSNGRKVYSVQNPDGTHTVKWKQDKPHAPYLFMLAVGNYSKVRDEWRNEVPVNYYVEPQYKPYARMIFGKTPQMMSYYSDVLDYDYPWAKYSQVAVRDFIAGAMENTSATIHFSGIQQDKRGHKHRSYETLIAHELFHHWFGNLVTCESWANLAMNEAFATYGEHLWMEHAHGDEAAGIEWQNDMRRYLYESRNKNVPLIQYHYKSKSNLFDAHRYQKGACILKMLRAELGDEAFFSGLSKFLHQNEYQPVEHHDLRLALEEVSGRDLKWFFDQWFCSAGHPELMVKKAYDSSRREADLIVEQHQDTNRFPVFRLPVTVNVHQANGRVKSYQMQIDEATDTFSFPVKNPPELINFDSEKVLLAEKTFHYPLNDWRYQFNNTQDYLNQYEAISHISRELANLSFQQVKAVTERALNNPYRRIRQIGLNMTTDTSYPGLQETFSQKVKMLAKNDPETHVRGSAFQTLAEYDNASKYISTFKAGLADSSYFVVRKAFQALKNTNKELALKASNKLKNTNDDALLLEVAKLKASHAQKQTNDFLQKILLERPNWDRRFSFVKFYLGYLKRIGPSYFHRNISALSKLEQWIGEEEDRENVTKALKSYRNAYQQTLDNLKASDKQKEEKITQQQQIIDKINELVDSFQSVE